ncbi:Protein phosphatase 2C [Giardia duodenalis assemblage B]|uniref:Protein phosphatase 2C n=2 Tax=Giardia intestinalis TaxID=5741 RepID=A0A132NZR4_GIAIN|nr:Protein phosphatase 2C [Giardia intestinalis]KWX15566.1 Protein phosphatase 2C [Giardia intestinalis assemblage B]
MDDLMVKLFALETLNSDYARAIVKEYAIEHSHDPILEPPVTEGRCQIPTCPIPRQTKLDKGTVIIEAFLPTMYLKTARKSMVCRFYLQGSCTRINCPYIHPPRHSD